MGGFSPSCFHKIPSVPQTWC